MINDGKELSKMDKFLERIKNTTERSSSWR